MNEQPSGPAVHLSRKPALRATHSHAVHGLTRKNSLVLLDFQIGMGCSCVLSPGSLKERTMLHSTGISNNSSLNPLAYDFTHLVIQVF